MGGWRRRHRQGRVRHGGGGEEDGGTEQWRRVHRFSPPMEWRRGVVMWCGVGGGGVPFICSRWRGVADRLPAPCRDGSCPSGPHGSIIVPRWVVQFGWCRA
jgi:hypothetical protein